LGDHPGIFCIFHFCFGGEDGALGRAEGDQEFRVNASADLLSGRNLFGQGIALVVGLA
jgi:hypothetical protein